MEFRRYKDLDSVDGSQPDPVDMHEVLRELLAPEVTDNSPVPDVVG